MAGIGSDCTRRSSAVESRTDSFTYEHLSSRQVESVPAQGRTLVCERSFVRQPKYAVRCWTVHIIPVPQRVCDEHPRRPPFTNAETKCRNSVKVDRFAAKPICHLGRNSRRDSGPDRQTGFVKPVIEPAPKRRIDHRPKVRHSQGPIEQ